MLRIPGRRAAEIQFDFTEGQRYTTPRENSGNKGSVARCDSDTGSHERSPYAPKFDDRSEEETLKQERCAHRDEWEVAKKYSQAQRKGQSYILLAFGCFGVYERQPERNQRKENLW